MLRCIKGWFCTQNVSWKALEAVAELPGLSKIEGFHGGEKLSREDKDLHGCDNGMEVGKTRQRHEIDKTVKNYDNKELI